MPKKPPLPLSSYPTGAGAMTSLPHPPAPGGGQMAIMLHSGISCFEVFPPETGGKKKGAETAGTGHRQNAGKQSEF